jgi:predicted RNA-binding Zn ribbon-like protein
VLTAEDLPLLGTEPLAVELANTDYGVGGPFPFDFLAQPDHARVWLTAAGLGAMADIAAVRALRDRARRLIVAALEGRPPRRADLDHVNRCAALLPSTPLLAFDNRGGWRSVPRTTGSARNRALQRLADSTITLLAGDDRDRLRVCASGDCTMLFVQAHHRRRFCHPSCSNRTRQARFVARQRAG